MTVFNHPAFDAHEHVSFFCDRAAGLRAIIAIHRLGALGMAGGGCRMWSYRDDGEALRDALRLSRAMTYKLALVELPAGGAKAVIVGDPHRDKSEALLLALGRAVERLGGRFVISEDVGTNPDDLRVVARATTWVSRHDDATADTAAATAYGVLAGMRAAVRRRLGRAELTGVRVALQGLGRVGLTLAHLLRDAGARLTVASLPHPGLDEVARQLGAVVVAPQAIATQEVDVFAPCALADVIDAETVPRLRCAVIAGSANNQLTDPALADALAARGILYVPDFAINAGGVIGAASSGAGDAAALRARLERIGTLVDGICERAARERVSTHEAAERTARERFRAMGGQP